MTSSSPLSGRDDAVRVHVARALAATLAVVALAGAIVVSGGRVPWLPEAAATAWPSTSLLWMPVVVASWVALAVPVRLRIGHNQLDVTVLDAVVAAAVWLLPIPVLVPTVVLGGLLHVVLVQRQRGHVALVNLTVVVLQTLATVGVLGLLVDLGDRSTVALVPTVAAAAVGACVSSLVVVLMAVLDEGDAAVASTAGRVLANLGVAASAGASGALLADLLVRGVAGWWLAGVPLVLAVVMGRLFVREQARAEGLSGAIDATRSIRTTEGPTAALQRMVDLLVDQFGAAGAELHRLPADGGTPTRFTGGDVDDAPPVFVHEHADDGPASLVPRVVVGRPFVGWGMTLGMTVPGGDVVRLRVWRRPSADRPYTRNDLEVFEGSCRAALLSFESSQMHEDLERLQHIDEMKTAFLTAVSHDLRTPLAVILSGALTLAKHHQSLGADQTTTMLERMAVQGRRLDQMLLDLLDIDRLQRGVIEPRREELDVAEVVAETVEAVAANTHPVRVSKEPVVGSVDRGHVARIVENLVRNAIKYTPAGTPIWVDVRHDALGSQLIVSDAGPGVPAAQRAAIFGAFVRGDDDHPSPGTGVGLDLVRRLAELHGGRAWVDERPGGGARFWVTLPDEVPAPRVEIDLAEVAGRG